MTTSPTPGPWKFSTSPEDWSYTIHISQEDGAPYTTGYSDVGYIVQTCRGEEESIQIANARLIAAAPDMLQALQELAERCEDSNDAMYGTLSTSFVKDVISAAIAKALGETK